MIKRKKPNEWKICQYPGCNKQIPQFWKTITEKGVRYKVCQKCASKYERFKAKEKVEKRKAKARLKRETITEKKLDIIFSRLVRNIYPDYCHSSKVSITVETSQCAHLVSRRYRSVRWDLRNCYPTTPAENMYNQLHVIQLAKRLKEYYNIDIEDWEIASKPTIKLNAQIRRDMYLVFQEYLDKVFQCKISFTGAQLEVELEKLRFEIINKTKLIL